MSEEQTLHAKGLVHTAETESHQHRTTLQQERDRNGQQTKDLGDLRDQLQNLADESERLKDQLKRSLFGDAQGLALDGEFINYSGNRLILNRTNKDSM